ncbi:MAG: hypothetical protein Q4B48_03920, partial [Syntrophomonadaceae bacterium]|nr:hypothetical protein [Syntrophomonadaceae bacterium]
MRRKLFIMMLAAIMLLGLCGAAAAAEARGVMALGSPSGIVELDDGSILVSDQFNKVIWRMEPGGEAVLYAGKIGVKDIYGEPTGVYRDGSLENSSFLSPWGLAPYLEGMAVTDAKAHAVRYIAEEGVFTAVGSGEAGYKDAHGIKAQFNNPTGIAADAAGGLYVADTNNHVIRHISSQGQVSTYAGSPISGRADGSLSAARFCEPTGLYYRGGALYVADSGNHRICKIQNGRVTTVAGMAATPYDDGAGCAGGYADGGASIARFSSPQGLAVAANGDIYVADTDNGAIRKISGQRVSTVLKQNDADATYPVAPRSILPVNDELLVTDTFAGILI